MLYLPRNLRFEAHQALCLPGNLHFEFHKVLRATKSIEGHRVLCLPGNLPTNHMSKSHDSLHLSRNPLLGNHHHVQSAEPATKTAFRSKTAPIPCTCHEKSTLEHQNTRFPLRLPRKAATMCENAHGTTTRAQSLEAPAAATQILRACAVEMHFDFESHECG